MSEMADMMARQTFMTLCIEIENLCASLYHYYGAVYEDAPEVSRLWKKTAMEEENHGRQFGLAWRLMGETGIDVMLESIGKAAAAKQGLERLLRRVKGTRPDMLQALTHAIELEENIAGLHAHSALVFKEDGIRTLFEALCSADEGHISDLKRMKLILSLPLSEMGEESVSAGIGSGRPVTVTERNGGKDDFR